MEHMSHKGVTYRMYEYSGKSIRNRQIKIIQNHKSIFPVTANSHEPTYNLWSFSLVIREIQRNAHTSNNLTFIMAKLQMSALPSVSKNIAHYELR